MQHPRTPAPALLALAALLATALLLLPVLPVLPGAGAPAAASTPVGSARTARAVSTTFPLADPDTIRAPDGRYYTYGTTTMRPADRCGRRSRWHRWNVPYLVTGRPGAGGTSSRCAAGDAFPKGPGAWAAKGAVVWAPGVIRFHGRYLLYYSATRRGTDQKCLGRAVARRASGPFHDRGRWFCPRNGRWALDPDPVTSGGHLYVALRDDSVIRDRRHRRETGLSVFRATASGRAMPGTKRTLLTSTQVRWAGKGRPRGAKRIVENPSLFRSTRGQWYVFFSGNAWASSRYSTGVAVCGRNPRPRHPCRPLKVTRPYFGHAGKGGLRPYRSLPGRRPGAGGMSVFRAADGGARVVWHWWDGAERQRYTEWGRLRRDRRGFVVV